METGPLTVVEFSRPQLYMRITTTHSTHGRDEVVQFVNDSVGQYLIVSCCRVVAVIVSMALANAIAAANSKVARGCGSNKLVGKILRNGDRVHKLDAQASRTVWNRQACEHRFDLCVEGETSLCCLETERTRSWSLTRVGYSHDHETTSALGNHRLEFVFHGSNRGREVVLDLNVVGSDPDEVHRVGANGSGRVGIHRVH